MNKSKKKAKSNKQLNRKEQINRVTLDVLLSIIENYRPFGLFYTKENGRYVGVDNRTGDAWTELFRCKHKCKKWLRYYD